MPILSSYPTDVNRFALRQQRMESSIAGYRIQLPPNNQIAAYIDGLAVRGRKFICGKDRFCKISLIVVSLYILFVLVPQVFRLWLSGVRP